MPEKVLLCCKAMAGTSWQHAQVRARPRASPQQPPPLPFVLSSAEAGRPSDFCPCGFGTSRPKGSPDSGLIRTVRV